VFLFLSVEGLGKLWVGGIRGKKARIRGLLTLAHVFLERRISFARGLAMGLADRFDERKKRERKKRRSSDRASSSQSSLPSSLVGLVPGR
jgi:enoyl-CoA hydratase/carnithine racemase